MKIAYCLHRLFVPRKASFSFFLWRFGSCRSLTSVFGGFQRRTLADNRMLPLCSYCINQYIVGQGFSLQDIVCFCIYRVKGIDILLRK